MGTYYQFTSLLVLMVFMYNLGGNSSIRVEAKRSKKHSDCQRCKIYIKSVNYWLEKTSRGKHEGGDTAWEEAKLKSYARSEMRLVEIQEGLCTELNLSTQDECYAITEKADNLLDKWWFHEDYQSLDLFSWLCIETLQHCCPENHYGPTCLQCPLDKNHKVCSGKGRCIGEGTRKGNGTCVCTHEYSGTLCEHCAEQFYMTNLGMCNSCHASCNGCNGDGPEACDKCNTGWQMTSGICLDTDECIDDTICKMNQFCINKEGSYECQDCDSSCGSCVGLGVKNCTSCHDDYVLINGMCVLERYVVQLFTASVIMIIAILYIVAKFSRYLAIYMIIFVAVIIYYYEKYTEVYILDITKFVYGWLSQS